MPAHAERALDVGCGEGTLARKLSRRATHVTAIDVDAQSLELARAHEDHGPIDYVRGDFMTFPFDVGSFDFVVCVAALHHMDPAAALERMRDLLAPNGTLAVLGLARSRPIVDLPRDVAAVVVNRAHRLTKTEWHSPAPTIWPPAHTYRESQALAERVLPGARYRRHLLWRYSIVWANRQRPAQAPSPV
jgi:2-polyprenyl-3-methyl-5-hydroxy-6-metoxy-1,4-benzoquinol methylase